MIQFSDLKRKVRAFARAKGANVAMMFALSLLPLAIAAGAGLDYAHAMMVRANMMDALDAAALAVGSQVNNKNTDFNTLAQDVFNANYKGPGHPTVTPDFGNQSVKVTGTDSVETTALAMAGVPNIAISASSMVVWGQTKLWVSLVLDNTGSMNDKDKTGLSKIAALKDASHQLLGKLQAAAASSNPGDVQVAIVPFAKDVNVGTAATTLNANWIGWTDWEGGVKATSNTVVPGSSVGWGSKCPWSSGCVSGPGSTSSVNNIPSSGTYKGYICPDAMGSADPGMSGHYYNGCYTSTATQTATTTTVNVVPVSVVWNCSELQSDLNKQNPPAPTCTQGTSTDQKATSSKTNTAYTNGYTGDSGPTTTSSTAKGTTYVEGNKSCKGNPTTCKWTRTYTDTRTDTIVTAVAYNFTHTWIPLSHSYWKGCIMDRDQDDDTGFATPGNKFPAENSGSCNSATVMPLNYKWDFASSNDSDNLSAKIDSMVANGGTNQTIGLAHGMQIQMTGAPYNAPAIPANTTRYIILLSDGLNTLDRWYGDGSNQSSQVNTRMAAACKVARDNGFIVYTLFVDLNGAQGNSQVLQDCATDTSKYYDLKKSSDIITAFNDIAQKITNLRVSH
ncbi:MAG TPA: pilus assembly protein TadG-related protein [Rhizomicrobium sp.]